LVLKANIMQEVWVNCNYGLEEYYQISNLGRVKTLPRIVNRGEGKQLMPEKILKTRIDKNGYEFVGLYVGKKKQIFKKIHNLVAELFIPNPEKKKCVNHKDGVKGNNRLDNLEWVTHKENTLHAVKNNLMKPPKGESHPFSVLKAEDVLLISKLYPFLNQVELSKKFNVSRKCVGNVLNNKSWKHV